jgi:transcriptional regulator with XRE-family HTH domain
MPSKSPSIAIKTADQLIALGQKIAAHRKALGISAAAAAEAAGMSRVTLHRIEKGQPSVTMGAYVNAITALGLNFGLIMPVELIEPQQSMNRDGWIPTRIPLSDYPQLKQLAWQVHGTETLTPIEAWDIYERNWRHIDKQALTAHERQLIKGLRSVFGGSGNHV